MKSWIMLIFSFISLSSGSVWAYEMKCISLWQDHVRNKVRKGVTPKHRPRIAFDPSVPPKESVVILSHGIFESPHFFEEIANELAGQGYLVLSLLLPGHWESDPRSLEKVHYSDWVKEFKMNMEIADCFSNKIVLAGHSLGGLLAINAALENPDRVSGLILWSPALKLNVLPRLGGLVGSTLGLNGNFFMRTKEDRDETAFFTPNAPNQIHNLIKSIYTKYGAEAYKKISAPTVLIYAENDPAVSVAEMKKFYDQISGDKKSIFYDSDSWVWHGNIAKSVWDVYHESPDNYNPDFYQMSFEIREFLRDNNL